MNLPLHDLYVLEAEAGAAPALKRIQEALDWFFSKDSGEVGTEFKRLLNQAHGLYDKPVTIMATATEQTAYENLLGQHTIKLNLGHLSEIKLPHSDGRLVEMSVERSLGHELVHASDPELLNHLAKNGGTITYEEWLDDIQKHASEKATAHLSEEMMHIVYEPLTQAMEATYYEAARKRVETYVDSHVMPLEADILAHLHADPEFQQYIEIIERPAVAFENRIAAQRGEPQLAHYGVGHHIPAALKREAYVDTFMKSLDIDQKPHFPRIHDSPVPKHAGSWQAFVKNKPELKIVATGHPRIATPHEGGRTS